MRLNIVKELKDLAYHMFRTFDTKYINFRPFMSEWIVKLPNTPTNVSTFQQRGRRALLAQLKKDQQKLLISNTLHREYKEALTQFFSTGEWPPALVWDHKVEAGVR